MRLLIISSLAAIGACTATANPPTLASAGEAQVQPFDAPAPAASRLSPIDCDVRAVRTPRGVRFDATAWSDARASGGYEFVITRRDRNGQSDIVQGGEYALGSGDGQSLGSAEVSVERGGGYHARLVLRDAEGVACRAERSR